jgi:hypothetical protein
MIDYGGRTNGAANNLGVYYPINTGGVNQMNYVFYTTDIVGGNYKSVFSSANNDTQLAYAGALLGSDSTVTIPTLNQAEFGQTNLHIKRLAYFPTRLSDDKLKSITT